MQLRYQVTILITESSETSCEAVFLVTSRQVEHVQVCVLLLFVVECYHYTFR